MLVASNYRRMILIVAKPQQLICSPSCRASVASPERNPRGCDSARQGQVNKGCCRLDNAAPQSQRGRQQEATAASVWLVATPGATSRWRLPTATMTLARKKIPTSRAPSGVHDYPLNRTSVLRSRRRWCAISVVLLAELAAYEATLAGELFLWSPFCQNLPTAQQKTASDLFSVPGRFNSYYTGFSRVTELDLDCQICASTPCLSLFHLHWPEAFAQENVAETSTTPLTIEPDNYPTPA